MRHTFQFEDQQTAVPGYVELLERAVSALRERYRVFDKGVIDRDIPYELRAQVNEQGLDWYVDQLLQGSSDGEIRLRFNGDRDLGVYIAHLTKQGLTIKRQQNGRVMAGMSTYPVVFQLQPQPFEDVLPSTTGQPLEVQLIYDEKDIVGRYLGGQLKPADAQKSLRQKIFSLFT